MKVALLSRYPSDPNRPRGGVEAVTVVLARALARLGDVEVHVVTLEKGRTALAVEEKPDLTLHRLPGSDWPQILDVLAGPGRKRLVDYLADLRPDLVHMHETYGLGLGGLRIPHVFTVHGFDHANLRADAARFGLVRSCLWRLVERYGLARQDCIISIAPYVRRMIEPLTRARIWDIANPVDERFFAVARNEQPGRILFAGWISDRKNTLGLVMAFDRIVQRRVQASLVIVGESRYPAYYQRLTAYIGEHGLKPRVQFLGHVDHDRLRAELAQTAIFVLPSRQENAPMAIAEAMACGVPVVSSNRCGMPDMICEAQTGFLVAPEDTDALADRMGQLLTDDALRARMGQAARLDALNRFHPDAVARRTRDVYQAAIEAF